jgi:uncharacterized protein (TIGR02391 family)
MNFYEVFAICPLTGLSTEGRAKLSPLPRATAGFPEQWLYEFKPIGRAIFPTEQVRAINKAIMWRASTGEGYVMSTVLAGLCREASELKREPLLITGTIYSQYYRSVSGPMSAGAATSPKPSKTFEEKRAHFLHLLSETAGKEYTERDIDTFDDFPLAFADDSKQFQQIINSLLDEKLLHYDEGVVVRGEWVNGIQTNYRGMLPIANGKLSLIGEPLIISKKITNVASPGFAIFHPGVQNAAKLLFTNGHYPQAIHAACSALEKAIQAKSGQSARVMGTALLGKAFHKDTPLITLSDDQGERKGYGFLYRGLLQAIRNHYAHNDPAIDPNRALEWLGFISALFYKLDEALPTAVSPIPWSLP